MKFIISLAEINKLLGKIQNVVAQKPTIPILSNFLIEAANDELVLTATDLTVGIRCYTEAKILEEGVDYPAGETLCPAYPRTDDPSHRSAY